MADAGQRVRCSIVDAFLVAEGELQTHQLGHGFLLEICSQLLICKRTHALVVGDDLERSALQLRPPFVDCHHHRQELLLVSGKLLILDAQGLVEVRDGMAVLCEHSPHAGAARIGLDGE